MPELRPADGWTEYRALTNLSATAERGIIADTAAAGVQWVYGVRQDIDPGMYSWRCRFQILGPDETTVLLDSTLTVPLHVIPGGGPFPPTWYAQNARIETTVPEHPDITRGSTEQPIILPLNNGDLPVYFEVYSAHYLIPLPAGAIFKIKHHELYNVDLTFPPIFTSVLPATRRRKKMLLDPVSSDQHLPRIESGMLVVRTALSTGGMTGVQSGLTVSYSGGVATVAPGTALVGFQRCMMLQAQTLEMSGTQYLFAVPGDAANGTLALATGAGPRDGAAICLGRLKGGRFVSCNGVLVADDVEDVAIARGESGAIVLRYDTATAQDVEAVSRDRGVTWE